MQSPAFSSKRTWLPALFFTLIFAGFYLLFFAGLFFR